MTKSWNPPPTASLRLCGGNIFWNEAGVAKFALTDGPESLVFWKRLAFVVTRDP